MCIFEHHLGIQRKPADLTGAGEILDLLYSGQIRTLASFFYVRRTGRSSCEEDIVAKMEQGLLSPKRTILSGLCHRGREHTEAQKCDHTARDHTPGCRMMLNGGTSAV